MNSKRCSRTPHWFASLQRDWGGLHETESILTGSVLKNDLFGIDRAAVLGVPPGRVLAGALGRGLAEQIERSLWIVTGPAEGHRLATCARVRRFRGANFGRRTY
jgi:hypothetical protein